MAFSTWEFLDVLPDFLLDLFRNRMWSIRGGQGNHMLVPHFFLKLYWGPLNIKKKQTQYVRVVLHKTFVCTESH